jgi:predicted hydrocarbon binding protein
MSLLQQRKGPPGPIPRLEGREVLVGPDPAQSKVKGVMFSGRKAFLVDTGGEQLYNEVLGKLSPATAGAVRTPLASSWYDFAALVEIDRAIYETLKTKQPNVLALIGAASAELGIGKVYRSLDSESLIQHLENNALFHNQYQKFGTVRFEKTATGGKMVYTNYPCFSPIYCASAVGFFMESILRHGGTEPNVVETKCQCLGDSSCMYEMVWR